MGQGRWPLHGDVPARRGSAARFLHGGGAAQSRRRHVCASDRTARGVVRAQSRRPRRHCASGRTAGVVRAQSRRPRRHCASDRTARGGVRAAAGARARGVGRPTRPRRGVPLADVAAQPRPRAAAADFATLAGGHAAVPGVAPPRAALAGDRRHAAGAGPDPQNFGRRGLREDDALRGLRRRAARRRDLASGPNECALFGVQHERAEGGRPQVRPARPVQLRRSPHRQRLGEAGRVPGRRSGHRHGRSAGHGKAGQGQGRARPRSRLLEGGRVRSQAVHVVGRARGDRGPRGHGGGRRAQQHQPHQDHEAGDARKAQGGSPRSCGRIVDRREAGPRRRARRPQSENQSQTVAQRVHQDVAARPGRAAPLVRALRTRPARRGPRYVSPCSHVGAVAVADPAPNPRPVPRQT